MAWYGKYEDDDDYITPQKKQDEKSQTQRYLNKDAEQTVKNEDEDDVRLKSDFD